MKPLTFIWLFHLNQPLGNFSEVFHDYSRTKVEPLLLALERHERLRLNLHFGGPLLLFLQKEKPELLLRLKTLVQAGKVELVGGGFYEPILGAIPPEDAVGQIQKTQNWLKHHLDAESRSVWLAESVWHAVLPVPLVQAKIQYVILEARQLMGAGLKASEMTHPFLTEWMGHALKVFPSDTTLGEQIPTQRLDETMATLRRLANRAETQVLTVAQPAERVDCPEWEIFLQRLMKETEWIEPHLLSEVSARYTQLKTIYVPSSSGRNVASYSLPSDVKVAFDKTMTEVRQRYDAARFEPFLRAGSWSGYYTKYAEVNQMQKKMLWLSRKWKELPAGPDAQEVKEFLWAAQNHSAYWHAQTAGCYANYLRDAVYQSLLQAERRMMQLRPELWSALEQADYDADLQEEIFLRQPAWSGVVKPSYGGAMVECNFLPTAYNLANTFTRREEAYHDRIPSAQQVPDDWYVRHMFQDHFVKPKTTLEEFANGTFIEFGDFVDQPYQIKDVGQDTFTLEREGGIYVEGKRRPLLVTKVYRLLPDNGWAVSYTVKNLGTLPVNVLFAVENNYTCLAGNSPERVLKWNSTQKKCGEPFELKPREKLQIVDSTRNLDWRWEASPSAAILHYPVSTISIAGETPQVDYQGSALLLAWPLYLTSTDHLSFEIRVQFHQNT